MKNIFIFLLPIFLFAQQKGIEPICVISGPSSFEVGETVTYSIPSSLGQCSNCYDWDISPSSGVVQIVGSDMNNSVQVMGISSGSFTITVTYFNETGCHQCELSGILVNECCVPETKGAYACRPTGGATSAFMFIDNLNCNVDWNSISSIVVSLSHGVTFIGGGSSQTFNNPTGEFGFTFNVPAYNCQQGIDFFNVTYTINFNNGCSPFTNTVRVNEGSAKKLEIFPNPANDVLNFKGSNLQDYYFSLIDINGNIILNNIKIKEQLDISQVEPGNYQYIILKGGTRFDSGSLIIK